MTAVLGVPELAITIPVALNDACRRAFAAQWTRSEHVSHVDGFRDRLATKLSELIHQAVDWDLQLPSRAQLTFAAAIAREIGVPVPAEALCFRGAMHAYLDAHAQAYKARNLPIGQRGSSFE